MSELRLKGLNYVVQMWCKKEKEKCKCLKIKHLHFDWYPEPGSNRHGLLHWCLRPARLPIPPSGHLDFGASSCSPFWDCESVVLVTLLLAGKAAAYRTKESAWKVDLPVKDAKVSDFSQNPKYFYRSNRYERLKFSIFV